MRRRGFSLVELLVSMALIIFIMAILSEAFASGFKSFRDLKALGDMNERLRTASSSIRRYLEADHFEGRKRMGDPNFWTDGPPREGFFKLAQYFGSTFEGTGANGVASSRGFSHILHFTAKLRGNLRGDFFSANYAGATGADVIKLNAISNGSDGYRDLANTYQAQWVEVALFLRETETGLSESGNSPDMLHALHLRTKALIPSLSADQTLTTKVADFSTYTNGSNYLNTPADVTMFERRMPYITPTVPKFPVAGVTCPPTIGEEDAASAKSDILLNDVLSFNVRVLVPGQTDFKDLAELDVFYTQKGPASPKVFDTWSQASQPSFGPALRNYGDPVATNAATEYWPNSIPRKAHFTLGQPDLRILAVQIQLRVWDAKTEQTRQVTLVVDM